MADEVMEEELLQSIDEVDARIQDFRKRVRALLADMQTDSRQLHSDKRDSEST